MASGLVMESPNSTKGSRHRPDCCSARTESAGRGFLGKRGKGRSPNRPAADKRKYAADKNGLVILKLEKALLAENPELKISEKP